MKTIGEIYRIKESSQEAVAVISNLGFRIDTKLGGFTLAFSNLLGFFPARRGGHP